MSYYLMVFEPSAAPLEREGFLAWSKAQTEWTEEHDYNNPRVCSPALSNWFFEIKRRFPAMNGPFAEGDVDDPHVTDYSFGHNVIYAAFAWSVAEEAYRVVLDRAASHGVGFYDISSPDGEVWSPQNGEYAVLHKEKAG